MRVREYYLGRSFADRANYPYGIERSGDFSLKECQILNRCGSLYQALLNGEVKDPNDDDVRLMAIMAKQIEPQTPEEKVWLKYLDKTEKHKAVPSMLVSYGKNGGDGLDFAEDVTFDSDDDF